MSLPNAKCCAFSPTEATRWLERLGSPNHLERLAAGQELVNLWGDAPRRAAAVMRRALDAGGANAISEVARAIAQVGATELAPELREVVASRHLPGRARKAATLALGHVEDEGGIAAIRGLLTHPNPMYRRASAEALGRVATPEVVDDLLTALRDEAWQVRMVAAVGLSGAITEVETIVGRLLETLECEPHDRTAEQIARALAEVAGLRALTRAEVAERFMAILATRGPWRVRKAAARGLGELGWSPARETLGWIAEDDPVADVAAQAAWSYARLSAP